MEARLSSRSFFFGGVLWLLVASPLWAIPDGTWSLDLSRAANRAFADEVADDDLGGWTDQGPAGDLRDFPVGDQTLQGFPFHILDPAKNEGRAVVVLRGRRKPTWPEAVTLSAGGRKAGWLTFLHTAGWPGTDKTRPFAQYEIQYEDGAVEVLKLHVGVETAGWWGPGQGDRCHVVWTARRKAAKVGVQAYVWKNPRRDSGIASVVFRSLQRMPVPILIAVTGSQKEWAYQPPPEDAVAPEGAKWPKVPSGGFPAPPVDVAKVLASSRKAVPATGKRKAPAKVQARQGHLVDERGDRLRLLGLALGVKTRDLPAEDRERLARWLVASGFNLLELSWEGHEDASWPKTYAAWSATAAAHRLYLKVVCSAPVNDGVDPFWTTPMENGVAPKDDPALALVTVRVETLEQAAQAKEALQAVGVLAPVSASPLGDETDPSTLSRSLDFSEGDASWDKPQRDMEGVTRFSNEAWVTAPESGLMADLSRYRRSGRPFLARAGHGWPNAYAVEGPMLHAVMGAFQDWDGLIVPDAWGGWDQASLSAGPAASAWPAAARLFPPGDIAPAKMTAPVGAGREAEGASASTELGWWAHGLYAGEGSPRVPAAKVDNRLEKVVADNGRWEWQGNIGVFRAGSPRSQVLVGFLSNRSLGNYAWDVKTTTPFAAFALTSLTADATALSRRVLLTALGRYEVEGAKFNPTRTALLVPGQGTLLAEPLKAQVTLYRSRVETGLRLRAFDAMGQPLPKDIKRTWVGKNLYFHWPEGALWVLLESDRQ